MQNNQILTIMQHSTPTLIRMNVDEGLNYVKKTLLYAELDIIYSYQIHTIINYLLRKALQRALRHIRTTYK